MGLKPIFRRGGQLTANSKDVKESVGSSVLPTSRMAKDTGYVCYQLEHVTWRKKRTHDPGQPLEGFTISALEDTQQAELLCDAYTRSDHEGRKSFTGELVGATDAEVTVAADEGVVAIPYSDINRSNLVEE